MINRASDWVLKQKRIIRGLSWRVYFAGQFHPVDGSEQLLCGVRYRHVIVLAFGYLSSQIDAKGFVPFADKLGGVEKRISKVLGTSLFHVRIG